MEEEPLLPGMLFSGGLRMIKDIGENELSVVRLTEQGQFVGERRRWMQWGVDPLRKGCYYSTQY